MNTLNFQSQADFYDNNKIKKINLNKLNQF